MEKQRYVFMLFGYPGSGKSYVAEWLAQHFHAVHLRADDLRVKMFDGDRPDLHTPENKALVNNALGYAYEQILHANAGSVVLDANFNQLHVRDKAREVAARYGVETTVVWVKTPQDTAKERIRSRAESGGHVIFDPNIIENMLKRMEMPDDSEHLITLDGLQSAQEQHADFMKQFAALQGDRVQ